MTLQAAGLLPDASLFVEEAWKDEQLQRISSSPI